MVTYVDFSGPRARLGNSVRERGAVLKIEGRILVAEARASGNFKEMNHALKLLAKAEAMMTQGARAIGLLAKVG